MHWRSDRDDEVAWDLFEMQAAKRNEKPKRNDDVVLPNEHLPSPDEVKIVRADILWLKSIGFDKIGIESIILHEHPVFTATMKIVRRLGPKRALLFLGDFFCVKNHSS